MRYIISGKNINVTEPLKEAVESKLSKLERYFSPDTEVHATLSVEKGVRTLRSPFRSRALSSVLNRTPTICTFLSIS